MGKTICVFSSSSNAIKEIYFNAAEELGRKLAEMNYTLIYGGGATGLMGATAKAVHAHGGRVTGVIPEALNVEGIVYDECDELIVTEGMRERKAVMDSRADAFIALPGGYGTLEEILEIITLKQLRYHSKAIVILNTNNFYDNLIKQFECFVDEYFAKPECIGLYYIANDAEDAINYIDNYKYVETGGKWMTHVDNSCG